jgi:Cys-tRNA(Pro)/Cys-tRNA(Cys) deacylase
MARGTPATSVLEKARAAFALHEYDYDPEAAKIGMAAATSLGVAPARMFKTLMARVETAKGGEIVCALLPSDAEMSLKKLAAAGGGKSAAMLKPEAAERATGYHVGGISPLGQRKRARTFADATLRGFDTVFVNGGRRGLQIEIAPESLIARLGAVVIDLKA